MIKGLEALFLKNSVLIFRNHQHKMPPGKRGIKALTVFIYGDLNSQMIVIESF